MSFAKHILSKCNGDVTFAKKILSVSATLSLEEGDIETFEQEVETFQILETMESNGKSSV